MADDWRVTLELGDDDAADALVHGLAQFELPDDRRARLGDRVAVSSDGGTVFLYADTEDVAREANALARERLRELGVTAECALARWHPVEERWEDASVPLPRTEEEWEAEHDRLQAREATESREEGTAEWEVRVELPDHHATRKLAERLEGEGIPVVRRWHYLLVGAVNEDQAHALAERIEREAPAARTVRVEASGEAAWELMPQNPFALFGGFGG